MPPLIDLTGQRFGRLTVINRAGINSYGKPTWNCLCDCGNYVVINAHELRNGDTKSCGCFKNEQIRIPHYTHKGTHDRLYKIWASMKTRCTNPKCKEYKDYGARGIRVCQEWMSSYEKFRNWAISAGYNATAERGECTLDRIDVNGNYEPKNCRWVSTYIQNQNKRNKKAGEF